MGTIRKIAAVLHRAFASKGCTSIAWALIIVLGGLLVIDYVERLL